MLGEQFLQEMRKVFDEIVNFLTRCRYFDEFVLQDSDLQILIFQCQVQVVQTLFQTFERLTLIFWSKILAFKNLEKKNEHVAYFKM